MWVKCTSDHKNLFTKQQVAKIVQVVLSTKVTNEPFPDRDRESSKYAKKKVFRLSSLPDFLAYPQINMDEAIDRLKAIGLQDWDKLTILGRVDHPDATTDLLVNLPKSKVSVLHHIGTFHTNHKWNTRI